MGHTNGYRRGTRYMFARGFRKHGALPLNKYLTTYKVGDIVDIKGVGSIHRGMPHKVYHGKTGTVYNVTASSVGVVVNKQVRGTILKKRINVRIEHVNHSKCRQDFLQRVKENELKKKEAKAKGQKYLAKRLPAQPRPGHFVAGTVPKVLQPVAFQFLQ
eukprot:m.104229 g.104229  ORF g.104229 m.104229 type:complete len:159 (-) comp14168_c1_seq1:60-536(-)